MAIADAVIDRDSVYILSPFNRVDYHPRYTALYGSNLLTRAKELKDLQKGDIFITTEGVGCPQGVPDGVHVFIWMLANYLGCRNDGIRYLSHNQRLATFTYAGKVLRLPSERIIHPYISAPIVEHAIHRAGLQHDGVILYERSSLRDVKKNIVLVDDDIPERIFWIVKQAAEDAGGQMVRLAEMDNSALLR